MRTILCLILWSLSGAAADGSSPLSNEGYPNPDIRKLESDRAFLYEPTADWTYSHHPHIAYFAGRYFAIWSNGHKDEDAPGQRVLISSSPDFVSWSEPKPLVDSLPGKATQEVVLTAAGFHQHEGTLTAYFAQYEHDYTDTQLRAVTTTDGVTWSDIHDLGIPVCSNHGPQRTRSGRLIIAGHTSFPYTDDSSGLSGWKMTGIYQRGMTGYSDDPASIWRIGEKMKWPTVLCEGSFYQTSDGAIRMPLRSTGEGYRGRLWITESRDDGETWSPPVVTEFTDNNTKFHFGRLPDGRYYYVGCPDPKPGSSRLPLVLSISNDGITFGQHYVIADEPFEKKAPGRHKGGDYGYPHTLVHDGYLHIIVSRQKEGVEVIRLPLDQLDEARAQQIKDMRFGMFICWSFSTFSGYEWTRGVEDVGFFRATGCDTDQWCRTAKEAGMNYVLFLTKHHDGFCLWDTDTAEWKVTNTPLGIDVLAELRRSCDKYGLKLALYFSEGDWTWIKGDVPADGLIPGSEKYGDPIWRTGENAELKRAQLKELCTRYGPIEFFWMDHAQGTGGLGHPETAEWVRRFQPDCFVGFNHGEPAGRLALRERGTPGNIGDTGASKYNVDAEMEYQGYLAAEFTYPIQPKHEGGADWFYSLPEHDDLCHPAEKIYQDYLGAVRYGNIFSINVGPDYEGKIRDIDAKTLKQVGEKIRSVDPSDGSR